MIPLEQPPYSTDENLKEYLSRMFNNVNISLQQSHIIPRQNTLPARPEVGGIYYFNAAIPSTSITAEGYWGYKSTGWVQLG